MLTKVFQSGHSQAVRIPKSMQLLHKNVDIKKIGYTIIITEVATSWSNTFARLSQLASDEKLTRAEQLKLEDRESFK